MSHEALMQPGKGDTNTDLRTTVSTLFNVSIQSARWYLIRLTFDIKHDGQLVSEALLHGLLQGWNLLSSILVSVD